MAGRRVALLHNHKDHVSVADDAPDDALAEYDCSETVLGLADALRAGGHSVTLLQADETLLDTIRQARPDICFNIAEGLRGDARESQAPALLEMLGIPYTGSKVLAHALSLDKAAAKRVWRDCGLRTAPFQTFRRWDEALAPGLAFPLFVKPVREGSGMGVTERSVVEDEEALRDQVRWVMQVYRQPALVEVFLPGREFTIGLLGNRFMADDTASGFYDRRGYHLFPVLEIDVSPLQESRALYTSYAKIERPLDLGYLCPAPIDEALAEEMRSLAVDAFEAIEGLDVARVDFRLGSDGRPYLMEINTLPGLNPTYSDIVIAARAEGMRYIDLVNEILRLAMLRYDMVEGDGEAAENRLRRLS